MLINQKAIKSVFKAQGKRVPKGYMEAINSLILATTEQCAKNGGVNREDVTVIASHSNFGLLGKYLNLAFAQLEKEGVVVHGNAPIGEWFARAKQLQLAGVK